ncbi:MAG: SRPBCC family protein [Vicinamibacterales bacterium]
MNSPLPFRRDSDAQTLATGLGLFSLALGAAELLAPRAVAELMGVRPDARTVGLLRAFGAREIASGVAVLSRPDATAPMSLRVMGDAIDLAALAAFMTDERTDGGRLGLAAAAVAGVTALDLLCAQRLNGRGREGRRRARADADRVHVERVTTINKPIEDVWAFWNDFRNFPAFMRHLESVELLDAARSRWRARGPLGTTVEWDAEIVEQREPEVLAWRSLPNSDLAHAGRVHFSRAPGARGTEVRVTLDYAPPAGSIGRGVAWLFRTAPDQQIHEDLHRFKQLVETGEIPLSDGPLMWRPGQPASDPEAIRRAAGVRS